MIPSPSEVENNSQWWHSETENTVIDHLDLYKSYSYNIVIYLNRGAILAPLSYWLIQIIVVPQQPQRGLNTVLAVLVVPVAISITLTG